MLVEFRVKNFRCFNEEQVLSLVASKRDEAHPDNLIAGDKFNLVKTTAVYGANASGKSNLLRAIHFTESFVRNSATKMNLGDKIRGLVPFRLDLAARGMPSSFELTIIVDGTRFKYGFSATQERVHSEFLVAYPKGRPQRWFEREFDDKTKQTTWVFRGPLKKEGRILKEKTRDNGLVLSRGAELNIEALNKIFLCFRNRMWFFDLSNPTEFLIERTAERVQSDRLFRDMVVAMIKAADFGIDDIVVSDLTVPLERVPEEIKQILSVELVREFLGTKRLGKEGFKGLRIETVHRQPELEVEERFSLSLDESNGTKRFFALCGPFLDALHEGAVVVVDGLECSMHPLLTRKLIELFQSPDANKNGAQLIFATHDSTLMDPELFRRDQIWLLEKNREGASELFSLYHFDTKDRPRNTEAFQRNYLAGRYGGVPKFGAIFEDMEFK